MNKGLLGVIVLASISTSVEAEIIRCPDWQSLVASERSAVVRSTAAPAGNFDATLARRRATLNVGEPLDATNLGGQVAAAAAAATASSCTYTVRPGDTLYSIARTQLGDVARHRAIISANRAVLQNPDVIRVGSVLTLPCGPAATAGQGGGSSPAAASAPQAAPIPTWSARRGEGFTSTVEKWARAAGYTVVIETAEDWTFAVDINERGSFRDVLQRVVRGLGAQGTPPAVQIFSNNVVKIGGL